MREFIEIKANAISIGNRTLVSGYGINDSDYQTKIIINGKRVECPVYRKWHSMLNRCYSDKYQARYPTYIGATVCKDWMTFSVFKDWMEKQDWQGKELDKDIIVAGNRMYSPDTCCFVPRALNLLLTDRGATRGDYPQGVSFDKWHEQYKAYCSYEGKQKHLGYHSAVEGASTVYRKYKHALVRKIASEQTDPRIMRGLVIHADLILRGES